MRPIRALIVLLAAALALADGAAFAQTVTSPAPDHVGVTIYRAPNRDRTRKIDFDWLEGYALITEQRTVTIPAGRAVIRFEGVAAGILPESAIVTGLPDGVREKNLDADLLSPRSLYDRSFGRPVTLRRESKGRIVEERAVIRSGPDGAAILQTKDGFEAANCTGKDSLVYDSVPAGLSAKPTLSVETEASHGGQVTITLSYLAWGFDWQANYVATMRPDGKSADLFAWVTLANTDVTSFVDADTKVVAGKLNREDEREGDTRFDEGKGVLSFRCAVSPIAVRDRVIFQSVPSPVMAMAAPEPPSVESDEMVVVTGSRLARPEDLGDLKLYSVPDRTTVAAMSQKQVALLDQQAVPVDVIYRTSVSDFDLRGGVMLTLRAQNRKEKGLGLSLPAGPVAVFQPLGERRLLIGEGSVGDMAVNQEVEIEIARSYQVTAEVEELPDDGGDWSEHSLNVTNANPFPIRFEAKLFVSEDYKRTKVSARLGRKDGADLWAVEVPANGTVKLRYRLKDVDND